MGNLGAGEILFILLIALVVFGPKKLPQIARQIGQAVQQFRRAASDATSEIMQNLEDPADVKDSPKPPRPGPRI